ncbi:MAG: hypothetical protein AVDCRST_MAG49-904, partial [uncultured Thermomicrobiales bacterium]
WATTTRTPPDRCGTASHGARDLGTSSSDHCRGARPGGGAWNR